MKKVIYLLLFVVGSLLIIQSPAYALGVPEVKIKKVKTTVGDDYAELKFNLVNYENNDRDIEIYYKRKGKNTEIYNIKKNDYNFENGKNYLVLGDLLPDTKYKIRFKIRDDDGRLIKTKVKYFTTRTKEKVEITGYDKYEINPGDELIIYGHGFGRRHNNSGKVEIGYYHEGGTTASIISWTPTEIKVKTPTSAVDGPVRVYAYKAYYNRDSRYSLYEAEDIGPDIDIIGKTKYECDDLDSKNSEIANTYNDLYIAAYGREIKCDELQFHLEHKTPYDRLETWLTQQDDYTIWKNFKKKYKKKVLYNKNKGMYKIVGNQVYRIPDFWTAAAWGLNIKKAVYISNDDMTRTDDTYILKSSVDDLSFVDGKYYKKVLKLISEKDVFIKNTKVNRYYNNKIDLFSNEDSDEEICDYVTCGSIY